MGRFSPELEGSEAIPLREDQNCEIRPSVELDPHLSGAETPPLGTFSPDLQR